MEIVSFRAQVLLGSSAHRAEVVLSDTTYVRLPIASLKGRNDAIKKAKAWVKAHGIEGVLKIQKCANEKLARHMQDCVDANTADGAGK